MIYLTSNIIFPIPAGYGGHCFPKDLGAMSYFAKMLGVDETLLTTIEEMNKYYRTNRDWENMKGRAVSDD